ncbi:uncharacterized protein LOC128211418 [Mya arenaria]|uniref:uncharacterized protein LOC128211418 n=1 Tax=Mya arenaria TaxID=6604 RepID=UPI0022E91C22|nr:uncharacterized protein LOC128211418 [Mya arenaria]
MGESKCLHSGDFSLQNKGVFKSSWVKKYGVLYGKTPDQHAYLEIYESQETFIENKGKGKPSEKKYELQHVKSVNLKVEKNSKGGTDYQIEIAFTRGQKVFMMFENKTQSDDWHTKLSLAADIADGDKTSDGPSLSIEHELENDDDSNNSDDEVITLNQMYGGGQSNVQKFAVIVEPSPLAKLCGVEGEMTIMLSDQQTMRFEDSKTHKSMYSFQLAWMRRFGKKGPSHFYFECGRKCPNGEGTVTCQTESARAMHKAITQLSKSRSDIVIPKKKEGKHSKEPAEELRTSTGQITAPSHALNVRRNHPGMQKMPILIPIKQPSNGDATFYEDAPSSPLRSSAGSGGSPVEAPSRSSGKSKSKPDIVQELTEKVGSMIKKDDQKSIKSKDELKKEKKEKERREKEEKKERERKEKEEKREKEKREKDEKKKSKKIESTDMPVKKRSKERIYDEPEIDYDNNQVVDDTYDTAISPTPDTKQQPAKKRSVIKPDLLYEDAEPACNNAASAQNAVEYAQPYIKKGGVPIPAQGVEYAEVGNINKAAWKEQGRTDEETIHEENYSNIKEAREEISNPPSLPERRYNEDDDDDDGENMYNTANLIPGKAKRHDNKKPENIYGIKSAKPAGPIMPDPAADYSSAEEEEEEEGDYAVAEEAPGYEDPKSLMNTNTRASAPIDGAYEETELAQAKPVKPSKIPPKPMSMKKPHPVIPQPQESLYEVVDKK